MDLSFILFEPQVPENAGAACRALKTMGFGPPRVVNSAVQQAPEARWLAHGSADLLDNIETFPTLEAALADRDLVIGTSAKPRGRLRQLHPPEALAELLREKAATAGRVALLFGREDRGLSNAELDRCDLLTSIPLAVSYPSLNLAQAVMLYAYCLSGLSPGAAASKPAKNPAGQLQALKGRVEALMDLLEQPAQSNLRGWVQARLVRMEAEDIHYLHALCTALERKLRDNNGV
ncbi:tRNA/rRNA methyltransferase [Motiliproteus sp. SC1-56]|uniref:tRNA/rRNA methyltransferase n=1 Tax=Motiliproteus sp. SC1-56 TaxID=2799565 RepID=UPI001A906324|nr:tRNA/rRNA methyltransferase [Motiliproteus sp. SC1-56]